MADDVVEELDAWLNVTRKRPDEQWLTSRWMIERARDEIVALRERCAISDVDLLIETGRNEALEEAARVCERAERRFREGLQWEIEADLVAKNAAAIRALKERSDG